MNDTVDYRTCVCMGVIAFIEFWKKVKSGKQIIKSVL